MSTKGDIIIEAQQHFRLPLSSLFRNVPSLISLEVSPFCFWFLSLIVVFLVFILGSVFGFCLWFFILSLALPGAELCGARRAERLGRSVGQGQRRRPHDREPA